MGPRQSEEARPVNPEMVALARESRGLTQREAARQLGISQGRLSKIEAGLAPTPDDVAARMVEVFRYPTRFFHLRDAILGPGTGEFFHRKRQAATARTLRQLHATLNVRMISIGKLLQAVEIERDDIPRLDPDDWSPSEIAEAVRAQWQLPSGPIPDLVRVIEDAGGIVVMSDFGTPLVDAVSRYVPGRPRVFFIDSTMPGDRQRLTLAHELGHVVMHQAPHPDMEAQAYEFAAELLMPARLIRPQFDRVSIPKLAAMKPYWKVSMAALLKRAADVGKVSPRMERYLWSQMSKAGYRTREPAELDIAREEPRLLQEILEVHRLELGYGLLELSELMGLVGDEAQATYAINPTKSEVRARLRALPGERTA